MSSSTLKIIALFFMIIDHVGYFFPHLAPSWFRIIGRISFPLFMFLFIESYFHTSSKKAYFCRLFKYAIAMFSVNCLTIYIFKLFDLNNHIISPLLPNIFITFVMCFLILGLLPQFKMPMRLTQRCNRIFILLLLLTLSAFIEYDIYAICIFLIFYIFHERIFLRNILFVLTSMTLPLILNNPYQMAMVLAILFISEYKGTEFYNKKYLLPKYFYYNFYIFHIVLFNLLSSFIS